MLESWIFIIVNPPLVHFRLPFFATPLTATGTADAKFVSGCEGLDAVPVPVGGYQDHDSLIHTIHPLFPGSEGVLMVGLVGKEMTIPVLEIL